MFKLPSPLPAKYSLLPGEAGAPSASPASAEFDVAFGGLGFRLTNSVEKPIIRQLADIQRQRVDQAAEAGEQTLTNWWYKSQSSLHGGVGQQNAEPAFPTPFDKIRCDTSVNLDVWTPGKVTVLPGSRSVVGANGAGLLSLVKSGVEAFAYYSGTSVMLVTVGTVTPVVADTTTTITAPASIISITTDGSRLFCVTSAGKVYRADATSTWTWVELYTGAVSPTVLSWVNDRLLMGDGQKVYQLDPNHAASSVVGASELVFTHPIIGWVWDGFAHSPSAILGYGWSGVMSTVTQFALTNVSGGIPTLTPAGVLEGLPPGERLQHAVNTMGSFWVMATTAGVRVGTFESFRGNLTFGPLSVVGTGFGGMCAADRFVYVAKQKTVTEPGLVRIDLGTVLDQANRCAYAYDRIGPVENLTAQTGYGAVALLPVTGRIVFTDDQGIYVSDPALTRTRSGYFRTSRIRFDLTEPKLFKFARVRGDFTNGSVKGTFTDSAGNTRNILTFSGAGDSGEVAVGGGPLEWIQLTITLTGDAVFNSYQVKALPGVPKQELITVVVSCQDRESSRNGAAYVRPRTAGPRRDALFDLAKIGDEIVFQEFQQTGTVNTRVIIQQCQFSQVGRPTAQQFVGGDITVQMLTVQ